MECPSCKAGAGEDDLFCPGCGQRLPIRIKDHIEKNIKLALQEIDPADASSNHSTPSETPDNFISKGNGSGDISYETDDARKVEYKRLLRQVFADGQVTAEEVVMLAGNMREHGLDKDEARSLQEDVARELGLDIADEGDLAAGQVLLEINSNKSYFVDEMDDLELRITNISDEKFEKVAVSSYLINKKTTEEKSLGALKASLKKKTFLPFCHSQRGNEVVEICLNYVDSQGNPSIYKSECRVRVLSRDEFAEGAKSISITFNAQKIMGNDFSDMAKILGNGTSQAREEIAASFEAEKILGNDFSNMAAILNKNKERAPERRSSYEEAEHYWKRLPVFFDEDETKKRRDELTIGRKLIAGEDKLRQGICLKTDADKMDKFSAIETFQRAFQVLNEAKECFKKVRELDPSHTISFERVKEIRQLISDIEGKIGILESIPETSSISLSSGCLTVNGAQKKIYLYSKDRITLGRDGKNDIVTRVVPYHPKEEYPENWQKSCQISGSHAEIINSMGLFYVRDTGSNGEGSSNGTFLDGKKLKPGEDYPLRDNMRLNIAKVLDLECSFLGEAKRKDNGQEGLTACVTVLGEMSDSCFGVDKRAEVNAIKIRRRNNYTDNEKYLIIVRETTIGRSKTNGIALEGNRVSDIHARLFFRDDQYWLEDLNSRHGTWVNGQKLVAGSEVSLSGQSEIMIGDVRMNFEGCP
jgi:pSer/pThr/pTyr-binding forkhead associated (FHA) protein